MMVFKCVNLIELNLIFFLIFKDIFKGYVIAPNNNKLRYETKKQTIVIIDRSINKKKCWNFFFN